MDLLYHDALVGAVYLGMQPAGFANCRFLSCDSFTSKSLLRRSASSSFLGRTHQNERSWQHGFMEARFQPL